MNLEWNCFRWLMAEMLVKTRFEKIVSLNQAFVANTEMALIDNNYDGNMDCELLLDIHFMDTVDRRLSNNLVGHTADHIHRVMVASVLELAATIAAFTFLTIQRSS